MTSEWTTGIDGKAGLDEFVTDSPEGLPGVRAYELTASGCFTISASPQGAVRGIGWPGGPEVRVIVRDHRRNPHAESSTQAELWETLGRPWGTQPALVVLRDAVVQPGGWRRARCLDEVVANLCARSRRRPQSMVRAG